MRASPQHQSCLRVLQLDAESPRDGPLRVPTLYLTLQCNFRGSDPSNSSLVLRTSRESAESGPEQADNTFPALFEFEGAGIELVVLALLGDEVIVGAAFDDAAMVKHHDNVGILHR